MSANKPVLGKKQSPKSCSRCHDFKSYLTLSSKNRRWTEKASPHTTRIIHPASPQHGINNACDGDGPSPLHANLRNLLFFATFRLDNVGTDPARTNAYFLLWVCEVHPVTFLIFSLSSRLRDSKVWRKRSCPISVLRQCGDLEWRDDQVRSGQVMLATHEPLSLHTSCL